MGKILVFVIAFIGVGFMAYRATREPAPPASSLAPDGTFQEASAPKRQLERVRDAAKRIEGEDQRRLDEVEKTLERTEH